MYYHIICIDHYAKFPAVRLFMANNTNFRDEENGKLLRLPRTLPTAASHNHQRLCKIWRYKTIVHAKFGLTLQVHSSVCGSCSNGGDGMLQILNNLGPRGWATSRSCRKLTLVLKKSRAVLTRPRRIFSLSLSPPRSNHLYVSNCSVALATHETRI